MSSGHPCFGQWFHRLCIYLCGAEGMSCFPPTGAPGLWDIPGGQCKRIYLSPRETELINSRGDHKFSHYLACGPEAGGGGWLGGGRWSRICPPICPGPACGWAVSCCSNSHIAQHMADVADQFYTDVCQFVHLPVCWRQTLITIKNNSQLLQ